MIQGTWRSLKVSSKELRLDLTLPAGQSFRWYQSIDDDDSNKQYWTGVVGDRIWTLSQQRRHVIDETDVVVAAANGNQEELLMYRVHPEPRNFEEVKECELSLIDYFQLDKASLSDLYDKWSTSDEHFRQIASKYPGVRVLRQDPVENLFTFLCSSNNNIKRITSMVETLCKLYGRELVTIDGRTYYRFPEIESLSSTVVIERLRSEKFGYRAEFIQRTAQKLCQEYTDSSRAGKLLKTSFVHSADESLRQMRHMSSYEEAKKHLMTLPGVGPKVADCVCLMSLDKTMAVPVDTHIFKLATHLYIDTKAPGNTSNTKDCVMKSKRSSSKSLTKTKYDQIVNRFNEVFGEYAGWAHSVLFTSDLSQFQTAEKVTDSIEVNLARATYAYILTQNQIPENKFHNRPRWKLHAKEKSIPDAESTSGIKENRCSKKSKRSR